MINGRPPLYMPTRLAAGFGVKEVPYLKRIHPNKVVPPLFFRLGNFFIYLDSCNISPSQTIVKKNILIIY
jgi:hypothetical protein